MKFRFVNPNAENARENVLLSNKYPMFFYLLENSSNGIKKTICKIKLCFSFIAHKIKVLVTILSLVTIRRYNFFGSSISQSNPTTILIFFSLYFYSSTSKAFFSTKTLKIVNSIANAKKIRSFFFFVFNCGILD